MSIQAPSTENTSLSHWNRSSCILGSVKLYLFFLLNIVTFLFVEEGTNSRCFNAPQSKNSCSFEMRKGEDGNGWRIRGSRQDKIIRYSWCDPVEFERWRDLTRILDFRLPLYPSNAVSSKWSAVWWTGQSPPPTQTPIHKHTAPCRTLNNMLIRCSFSLSNKLKKHTNTITNMFAFNFSSFYICYPSFGKQL